MYPVILMSVKVSETLTFCWLLYFLFRFYMDLESEENAEKDEFFVECLSDPTLRDQMSILTRKFKNKMQVNENCKSNV